MNATQDLQHEHEIVKHMLKISNNIAAQLEAGEALNVDHFEQILEFLTVFVDKCHHGKEEDLLFPAMEKARAAQVQPMIAQMLAEHQQGRAFVRNIKQAFHAYKTGDSNALATIIGNVRGYAELLTRHIEKEDTILYAVAAESLTQAQQDQLVEGFEKIEHDIIGAGKHEEFHNLIHHLEKIYVR